MEDPSTSDAKVKTKEQTEKDKGTINCMPDNPFIPDSSKEKLKSFSDSVYFKLLCICLLSKL